MMLNHLNDSENFWTKNSEPGFSKTAVFTKSKEIIIIFIITGAKCIIIVQLFQKIRKLSFGWKDSLHKFTPLFLYKYKFFHCPIKLIFQILHPFHLKLDLKLFQLLHFFSVNGSANISIFFSFSSKAEP